MNIIKHIGLVLLLVAVTSTLKAQKRQPDTSSVKLAEKLGATAEHARDVRAAMLYHRDDMEKVIKDGAIPPGKKQEILVRLMAERQQRINAVTTPEERERLATAATNRPAETLVKRQQLLQQAEAAMSQRAIKKEQ